MGRQLDTAFIHAKTYHKGSPKVDSTCEA